MKALTTGLVITISLATPGLNGSWPVILAYAWVYEYISAFRIRCCKRMWRRKRGKSISKQQNMIIFWCLLLLLGVVTEFWLGSVGGGGVDDIHPSISPPVLGLNGLSVLGSSPVFRYLTGGDYEERMPQTENEPLGWGNKYRYELQKQGVF